MDGHAERNGRAWATGVLPVHSLPLGEMFPADRYWLAKIFFDEPFEADVYFSEDGKHADHVEFYERTF
ncbi:MAG: hypothetical protein P4L81_04495 [Candidatus Pacebacteria bacterium]|nr:hypothetical protein [Candidatus Paceibacterota bacterium]